MGTQAPSSFRRKPDWHRHLNCSTSVLSHLNRATKEMQESGGQDLERTYSSLGPQQGAGAGKIQQLLS
jgi:hypothetical protein